MRLALLAEARTNYTFGQPRPTQSDTTLPGNAVANLPTVTIATVSPQSRTGRPPGNYFVARLVSSGAYEPLGIGPDTSYLWTDTTTGPEGGQRRVLVVPTNPDCPMVWLEIGSDHARLKSGSFESVVKEGRGRLRVCVDGCKTGHCSIDVKQRRYQGALDNPTVRITLGP